MTGHDDAGDVAVTHAFDRDYWDRHWQARADGDLPALAISPPHPHLARETAHLGPGTALDAGCGAGAEAIWLASRGWQVTAVDIAQEALGRAARRAAESGVADRVRWVRADLTTWEPGATYDLVTSSYAHPAMPQLEFYDRIATWVAPGGTLLVVGHLHHGHGTGGDEPPASASVTADAITARLDPATWDVATAEQSSRTLPGHVRGAVTLHDVVVRATRRR